MQFTIVLLCIGLVVCQQSEKFENVYKGEGVNCEGVFSNITLNSNLVTRSEEGVAVAVAQAIADATQVVAQAIDTTTLIAQADVTAKVVVSVVASAVASVGGMINSPNEGCWAIGYGKAEAIAIANATASAVAQGLAAAALPQDKLALAEAEVQTVQNDIKVAVETVALLLVDGSGGGIQEGFKSQEAVAKVEAINCALVAVFAAVAEGDAFAEVFAESGCVEIFAETALRNPIASQGDFTGCSCVSPFTNKGVVPNFCGTWGDQEKQDTICYVEDPFACSCAQLSVKYAGAPQTQAWRYCGTTLQEMQSFLSISDDSNNISSISAGFGYCSPQAWDVSLDPQGSSSSSVPILSIDTLPPVIQQDPLLAVDTQDPTLSSEIKDTSPILSEPSPAPIQPPSPMLTSPPTPKPTPYSMPPPTPMPIPYPMPPPTPMPTPYPAPPPTATPSPTPTPKLVGNSVQLLSQCPLFYCIDESFECCQKSVDGLGGVCDTSNGLHYVYVGKCAVTLQDVWKPTYGNTCKCTT